MMQQARVIILGVVIVAIVGLVFYFESQKPRRVVIENSEISAKGGSAFGGKTPDTAMNKEDLPAGRQGKQNKYPLAKEITTPDGFINVDKISVGELVGKKVVLVDFWTYSCINCQRTIPYLNTWYEKYKDKGLVIIGVHTPEFEFEKKYENVLAAAKKFNIQYPVVLDNDFSTWNAYGNRYWPRKYLIDIDGYIVYDHIGEGAYEETEKKIQELLEERSVALGAREDIAKDTSRPAQIIETNFSQPRSPEIYFGAARNTFLGNGNTNVTGLQNLSGSKDIKKNLLYLSGNWNFEDEFAENKSSQAKIIFRYQAKNVYFVARSDSYIRIKILNDGKQIGEQTIKAAQTYQVISDSDYGDHTLEIIIENPGLQAFTFTFG